MTVSRWPFVACFFLLTCGPGWDRPLPAPRRLPGGCEGGAPGIDVSTFNGRLDWGAIAGSGIAFGFAKATEGLTIQDDRFAENWAGMKDAGVIRGAYHFFHPGDDGTAQADVFLAATGSFEDGDLPPVLDWEATDDSDARTAVANAQAFAAEIALITGRTAMIYTYKSFWDALGDPTAFGDNPLWLASYRKDCPSAPAPWSESGWLFWQFTDEGQIPGAAGPVDRDRFAGTLGDLLELVGLDAGGNQRPDPGGDEVDAGNASGSIDAGSASDGTLAGESARPGCSTASGKAGIPLCSLAICIGRRRRRAPQVMR